MKLTSRHLAGLLVTAAFAGVLGLGSRAAYTQPGAENGLLRLSWRLRGEKIETCRPYTEKELEHIPIHMRTPELCTGHLVSYRVVVEIDDERPDTVIFVPEGAKGDRPVFVLYDRPLTPGEHEVEVEVEPVVAGNAAHRLEEIEYEDRVTVRAGEVVLVTMGRDGRLGRAQQ